jgi:hypothetical protein
MIEEREMGGKMEKKSKVAHHVRRDPQTDIQPALLPSRSFILRKNTKQNSSGPLEKSMKMAKENQ